MVPATFWNADLADSPPPVVLVQHGGPFHTRHEQSDSLARTIVERLDSAVLLIDGPIHGRRRTDELGPQDMLAAFRQYWSEDGGIDDMVSDWTAALDTVLDRGWADQERVAWLGVSMGTAYGIPLCAACDRIKGAALGMWGLGWGNDEILIREARRMTTPALFQIKDRDEFFGTRSQRDLFDALGSADKCLRTFAGGHSLTAPGQLDQLLGFIAETLASDEIRSPSI